MLLPATPAFNFLCNCVDCFHLSSSLTREYILGAHVIMLDEDLYNERVGQFIHNVEQDPDVDYIEEDMLIGGCAW